MTEISYITQNGEQVNLKDAKGRELLAEKQVKLKAGRGISIANDGTISVIGSGSSATGFFINASGDFNNLTFDKTPVEVNAAIEQGNIIIVNANNAKFLLSDVNNETYLFSYLVAAGEDCLAQIATIIATAADDTWQTIETNFVAIKTKIGTDNSIDIGADFSEWSKFDPDSVIIEDMELKEDGELGIKHRNPNYNEWDSYNNNKQYLCDNVNIDENFVKNNKTDKIIIDDARYQIVDKNLRELIKTYQDNLEFSDDFEVLEDGTISLKEVNNG